MTADHKATAAQVLRLVSASIGLASAPMKTGPYSWIGTLAQVLQLLKLPDGTIKVLVEGLVRARVGAGSTARHRRRPARIGRV